MNVRRALAGWSVIAVAMVLNGGLRTVVLAPLFGDRAARQISASTGAAIIVFIAYLLISWLEPRTRISLFVIGSIWVGLTLVFDVALGRIMGLSWQRILFEFDVTNGALMLPLLLVVLFSPFLAAAIRRLPIPAV